MRFEARFPELFEGSQTNAGSHEGMPVQYCVGAPLSTPPVNLLPFFLLLPACESGLVLLSGRVGRAPGVGTLNVNAPFTWTPHTHTHPCIHPGDSPPPSATMYLTPTSTRAASCCECPSMHSCPRKQLSGHCQDTVGTRGAWVDSQASFPTRVWVWQSPGVL